MAENFSPKPNAAQLFESLEDSELSDFEASIGVELPTEYREFLLDWNGLEFLIDGMQERVICPSQPVDGHSSHVPDWKNWVPEQRRTVFDGISGIEVLFGIPADRSPECWNSLWHSNQIYDFDLWCPSRFMVIGVAQEGVELLCMSIARPDRGQIFDWTIPTGETPDANSPSLYCMGWIAPNFREFWDSMRRVSIDEYFEWSP